MSAPRLELLGIRKRYGTVVANDGIDLTVRAGEIHALLGENGAGKSTLMKVIYGVVRPDEGDLRFDGRPARIRSPDDARALGISMVFQHFSVFETLTVAENIWLGAGRKETLTEVTRRLTHVMKGYGLEVDPRRLVGTLSVGERQRVEIVRALLATPSLLILDEPTSVLTPQAALSLFGTLRRLAAEGCSVLYITHKLDEVRDLCHVCTILRAGRVVARAVDPTQETRRSLAARMLDAEVPNVRRPATDAGEVVLHVRELSAAAPDAHGTALRSIDLQVRAREVLGIAGVSGNGQNELMAALSGETKVPPGVVHLRDHDVGPLPPGDRRALGLRFVPEERIGRGAVAELSLVMNTVLTRSEATVKRGFLLMRAARACADRIIALFGVRPPVARALAGTLSGGNLQKFIVGREIDAAPKVIVVAQPTWGVDLGAATRIREDLVKLAAGGAAVVVISEELEELFQISNRLAVLAGGRLSPTIAIEEATLEKIGEWMGGLWDAEPEAKSA